jgi:two-component system OmpR family response regulator
MALSLGRILVVDDEPQVCAMLGELLGEIGYAVKTAMRGAEALQIVPTFEPNVVLLDLQMPGMSGLQVLDHLRRDHPHIPVVVVTGNTDVEVARTTLIRGAFDYVHKPFELDLLTRVVAAAIVLPPSGGGVRRSDHQPT